MRAALRFWGSAAGVALLLSATSAWLLPYQALRLDPGPLRFRAWLLTVWTAGLLAVCFGIAGLIGAGSLGFREVVEAGSLARAAEARRALRAGGTAFHGNFAWWLIALGAILILIYFLAWSAGSRLEFWSQ